MKITGCVLDWHGGTRDWSRYHHTLTEHNTIPVRGVNGDGKEFNGVDAYIDCGNDASLNITDAITIEMPIKLNQVGINQYILAKILDIGVGESYRILITNNNKIAFNISDIGSNSNEISITTLNQDIWYHIIVEYETGGTYTFYLNGSQISTEGNGNASGDILISTADLLLGCRNDASEGIKKLFFNGTISSVKIYNRALTPLEIWNNYVTMKPYIPLSESPVAIV